MEAMEAELIAAEEEEKKRVEEEKKKAEEEERKRKETEEFNRRAGELSKIKVRRAMEVADEHRRKVQEAKEAGGSDRPKPGPPCWQCHKSEIECVRRCVGYIFF
jgi:hypothetical protein